MKYTFLQNLLSPNRITDSKSTKNKILVNVYNIVNTYCCTNFHRQYHCDNLALGIDYRFSGILVP